MKSRLRLEFGSKLGISVLLASGDWKWEDFGFGRQNSVYINVQHLLLDEPRCNSDVRIEGSDACGIPRATENAKVIR